MEKDEWMNDDLLREWIQRSPLDSPSEGFTERVMERLVAEPEPEPERMRLTDYLKQWFPFVLLALVFLGVAMTSDLPGFGWLPGKEYLADRLIPIASACLTSLLRVFSDTYIQWGLMIGVSAGALFLVDRFFTGRTAF